MASPSTQPRPGLRFIWLSIFTAVLAAIIAGGALWSHASWSPKLALDLEGGTSIILEPQVSKDTQINKEQLEQAVAIIRQRVDATGVSEAEITTQGDRNIIVNLPGNPDEETRNLVRSSAQLSFRRVAYVGEPGPITGDKPEEKKQPELSDEEKKRLEDILGPTEAPTGGGEVSKPAAATAGQATGTSGTANQEDSARADSAQAGGKAQPSPTGSQAPTPAETKKSETQQVPRFDPQTDQSWMNEKLMSQFAQLDCTKDENRTGGSSGPADEPIVACAKDGSAKYILGPVELSGQHVSDAGFGYESTPSGTQTNRLAVNMEFDSVGAKVFGQITQAITGQQPPLNMFAIVLDGLVLSAPQSQSAVTDGKAQITGNFTQQEAETLANQLKNGALPISFQVQSEQQISPTLGADYLAKGVLAGLIGLLLVVVYSLLQYRVLGMVTVSSLVVVGVLTYLLLLLVSWRYGYRLSLAGITGIIIGIGMAADSFIVYFERVRDELRSGRKLLSAVEVGWQRAKRTIYASKAVNMLAAVILYILAVGSVRGFAFTLGMTVIIDVLIVVLFTHPMLQVLARTKFFGEGHPMSGMDPRQLGVKMAAYRGAMNLDLDKAREKSKKRNSYKEAKRRQAQTERRVAEAEGTSLAARKAARAQAATKDAGTEGSAVNEAATDDAAAKDAATTAKTTKSSTATKANRSQRKTKGEAK